MLIGEVAKRAHVPSATIRYYESQKLVTPASRSTAGYRVYSDRVLGELTFIRQAQRLGFALDEIREILGMGRGGRKPCARVAALCDSHLREIDQRMRELRAFKRNLTEAKRLAESECGLTPEGFCRAVLGKGSN